MLIQKIKPPKPEVFLYNYQLLIIFEIVNLYIYIFIILADVFIGFYGLFKKRFSFLYLKLFPFFLLISLTAELIGIYFIYVLKRHSNLFIYNPFSAFEFVFYIWLLRAIIRNKLVKKILIVLLVLYPIGAGINIYFFQGINGFHSITYAVGCLLIITFSTYYFYELFLIPEPVNLLFEPAFWICTGLLFFYSCTFPLFGLSNIVTSLPRIIINNIEIIINMLNSLLYLMFSIAFLCTIRKTK